jgi:hypothetical protein
MLTGQTPGRPAAERAKLRRWRIGGWRIAKSSSIVVVGRRWRIVAARLLPERKRELGGYTELPFLAEPTSRSNHAIVSEDQLE